MSFRRTRNEGALPVAVWDREASEDAGEVARSIIEERAFEDGLTIDGGQMRPYSEEYALATGKTRVDLQATGAMRAALRSHATLGKVRVNAGRLRQVVFQNRIRPWLGVGSDDIRRLHQALTQAAERAINRSRRRAR